MLEKRHQPHFLSTFPTQIVLETSNMVPYYLSHRYPTSGICLQITPFTKTNNLEHYHSIMIDYVDIFMNCNCEDQTKERHLKGVFRFLLRISETLHFNNLRRF